MENINANVANMFCCKSKLFDSRQKCPSLFVQNANNLWLLFYSFARLVESLQEDYKARAPYLAYLVNAHQGLLATHSHLERLVERVER